MGHNLRFLTISILLLSASGYAAQHALGEEILEYRLKVSFDIPASKIAGVATIPVKSGQELKLRNHPE